MKLLWKTNPHCGLEPFLCSGSVYFPSSAAWNPSLHKLSLDSFFRLRSQKESVHIRSIHCRPPPSLKCIVNNAWPYIQGHQGCTVVLVISAEVVENPLIDGIYQDLSLLHGLGIRLVIIPGTHVQIDKLLKEKGKNPQYVGSYRITDDAALEASMEVAGKFRLAIEAKLSSQPSIPLLRRHGDNDRWHTGVGVASGNFVAAKRRGVVDGVDFGFTGEVKRLDTARIKKRLDDNCIVILSNLGYSSSGEVLNCNTYEVATACAIELQADKLISFLDSPLVDDNGRVIRFMTVQDADEAIRKRAQQSATAASYVKAVAGINYVKSLGIGIEEPSIQKENSYTNGVASKTVKNNGPVRTAESEDASQRGQGLAIGGEERLSREYGYLSELTAAVFVCRNGVRRVHLLDATIEGVLLLELYTRDGIGTMVASDRYEGTRLANVSDVPKIEELLQPLEESGVLIKRTREQLSKDVGSFIVVERDASIIACAALLPYHRERCAEVAALAVASECRGHGQGDKLLDYMENKALNMGLEKLFLLTTRTADWFVRRGFSQCTIDNIPEDRRAKIDLTRGSKYYMKKLVSIKQG
ncbi:hypothetical protein GOP47_0009701 [Adiantum capillus-veneris]|uniref:amino-acid N-acetyltransferase n=1 Tax=Adiantum capillus-veneris TaxID=13818 RepID=A0A9D4ZJX2_ADICA|nr:hypothetical protein GOP47_0009701 [Adiantum capillus-veneris]